MLANKSNYVKRDKVVYVGTIQPKPTAPEKPKEPEKPEETDPPQTGAESAAPAPGEEAAA